MPNSSGTYTISLALTCTYTLSASNTTIPASGSQNNTVNVVSDNQSCPFVAISNSSWITVTSGGSNVTGSGTVTFDVAPNNGTARTGTLTIAGQTYTITQPGAIQPGTAIPVKPNATYLRTNDDPQSDNAVPIDLNALEIAPGDILELKQLGGYAYYSGCPACQPPISSDPETATAITGVFSSTNTLLSSSQLNRVPGAIPANSFPVFTPDTSVGAMKTDIPQDFNISTGNINSVNIVVPQNARYLFVSAGDIFWGDNGDSDNDFALQITKIPSPQNCVYSLSSAAINAPISGLSNQQFNLLTQTGCPYLAVSNQPWLTTSSSGSGNGIIRYSVAETPAALREPEQSRLADKHLPSIRKHL
ncbi:MAG: BACON domain-containing protein [Pyrinomonadaceae bacterium]